MVGSRKFITFVRECREKVKIVEEGRWSEREREKRKGEKEKERLSINKER